MTISNFDHVCRAMVHRLKLDCNQNIFLQSRVVPGFQLSSISLNKHPQFTHHSLDIYDSWLNLNQPYNQSPLPSLWHIILSSLGYHKETLVLSGLPVQSYLHPCKLRQPKMVGARTTDFWILCTVSVNTMFFINNVQFSTY